MTTATMEKSATKVVTPAEWLAARKQFLAKEKEFTRMRDELSRLRRELPWEKVEKNYVFEGANGKETLSDLFGRSGQLVIYHFMFGPGWKEGCPSCSYLADSFDGARVHLGQRDTAFAVVSRATYPEIEAFKKRMGWQFKWVSSFGTEFQLRLPGQLVEERGWQAILQLRDDRVPVRGIAGNERVHQARR